jgi:hypothetical protein
LQPIVGSRYRAKVEPIRIACLLSLVLVAALAASCSSGAEGVSGKLDTSVCSNLASGATSLMGNVSTDLATSKNTDALRETLHLVESKRRAYQGGCISHDEYLTFLTENADAASTYHCSKCVQVFRRQLSALNGSG